MVKFSYIFLIFIQILTGTCIFFSVNPIHSILFLILLFIESTAVLFLFNVEFVSLLFILVYVGAIAVLFLFVVMMLQIKLNETFSGYSFAIYLSLTLFACVLFFLNKTDYQLLIELSDFNTDDFFFLKDPHEVLHEVHVLGQILFNYYILCFLIAGIILLLALVGSIILTLDFNKPRTSNVVFRRLVRDSNFLSYFQ